MGFIMLVLRSVYFGRVSIGNCVKFPMYNTSNQRLQRGHIYLKTPAAFSYRFVLYVTFLRPLIASVVQRESNTVPNGHLALPYLGPCQHL